MTTIAVECPACRVVEPVSASCLLLEIGNVASENGSSCAFWICDTCRELVALPVDLTVLIRLVTAGVSVLDTAPEDASPANQATGTNKGRRARRRRP
jgi:hypothetical protein